MKIDASVKRLIEDASVGKGKAKYLGVGEFYFIPSGSELGGFYLVTYNEKRGWACGSCRAFRFSSREDGGCHHIDEAVELRKARTKSKPDKKRRSSVGRAKTK